MKKKKKKDENNNNNNNDNEHLDDVEGGGRPAGAFDVMLPHGHVVAVQRLCPLAL